MLAGAAYLLTRWLLLPQRVAPWSPNYLLGKGTDPGQYVWSLAWWPYAISHGLNPFISKVVWAPQGFNLTWDASIPALAIMAWPLTALAGPVVAFNILTFIAPVAAGVGAYLLCYALVRKPWPALVGGWLFAFSSYEMAQSQSHLNLDWTVAVPLLGWLAVERFRGTRGQKAYVVATGLLLAFEFGTSIEIFATLTLFAIAAWLIAATLVSDERGRLHALAHDAALAYAICVVVCLPYLVYFALGSDQVPAIIRSALTYSTDLYNFVIPTPVAALGGAAARPLTTLFTGNYGEDGAYLGIPVLCVLGYFAWTRRHSPWAATALVLVGLTAIATLGPRLHVGGAIGPRLPWVVADHLPLLNSALPARVTIYLAALVSAIAAAVLAGTGRRWWVGVAAAVLMVASLWPATLPGLRVVPPAWVSSREYARLFPPAATLVVLPYGSTGNSMLWQALSGFYFRMAGGYTTIVPLSFSREAPVGWFFAGELPHRFGPLLTHFCQDHRVLAIVVDGRALRSWAPALQDLGWRRTSVGDSAVFWVPTVH